MAHIVTWRTRHRNNEASSEQDLQTMWNSVGRLLVHISEEKWMHQWSNHTRIQQQRLVRTDQTSRETPQDQHGQKRTQSLMTSLRDHLKIKLWMMDLLKSHR